jgi:hypothetical protein
MKTLVLYTCCEDNIRVQFFIKNGIFKADDVDFLFVINDKSLKLELPPYVMVINRENIGFDFGAWSYAALHDEMYSKYDYFIFLNQSVVGPYYKDTSKRWTDIFLSKLTNETRLVGSTINAMCYGNSKNLHMAHIQSFAFCMNRETFLFLVGKGIFSTDLRFTEKIDVIHHCEISMSRFIIENNWNIGCHLKYYDGVDFRFKIKKADDYGIVWLGDICRPKYENILYTRDEIMFIKGNRI